MESYILGHGAVMYITINHSLGQIGYYMRYCIRDPSRVQKTLVIRESADEMNFLSLIIYFLVY